MLSLEPAPECATFSAMPPSELYQTILTAFADEKWQFAEVADREVVQAGFEAHHTRVELHVQAFQQLSGISVVSEMPHGTNDPARRERLAELAMRANEMLTIGNFEMRWEYGKLMFRVSNLFSTPQGDPDIIKGLIHTTVAEMDRIAPACTTILQSEGAELAALNIPELMNREDLLPDIDAP